MIYDDLVKKFAKKNDLEYEEAAQFIAGCINNKVPKEIAEQYWEKFITPFAFYGFNKCLSGNMKIFDKCSNEFYSLKDLCDKFKSGKLESTFIADSWMNGEVVEDEIIDVFETGEKDIYEITLNNDLKIECTLSHKFLCSDEVFRTVEEVIEGNYEIIYES